MSPLRDFHLISQDFLQLMAKKQKQANINTEAQKELDVLDNFYQIVTKIIQDAEMQMHEARLMSVNRHVVSKLLETELRAVYNQLHQSNYSQLPDLLKKTFVLSKKEMTDPLSVKI